MIKKIKIHKDPEINLVNETETFLFDPKVDSLGFFKSNGLSSLELDCYTDFKEKINLKSK